MFEDDLGCWWTSVSVRTLKNLLAGLNCLHSLVSVVNVGYLEGTLGSASGRPSTCHNGGVARAADVDIVRPPRDAAAL